MDDSSQLIENFTPADNVSPAFGYTRRTSANANGKDASAQKVAWARRIVVSSYLALVDWWFLTGVIVDSFGLKITAFGWFLISVLLVLFSKSMAK